MGFLANLSVPSVYFMHVPWGSKVATIFIYGEDWLAKALGFKFGAGVGVWRWVGSLALDGEFGAGVKSLISLVISGASTYKSPCPP